MLKELERTCIDGLYIDKSRGLLIDTNKVKHRVAAGTKSIVTRVARDYYKIEYDGCVDGVGKLYKIDSTGRVLHIGDTLYEFSYMGSYSLDLAKLGIIRDIVDIMFAMCLGVKDVVEVIRLVNTRVFNNRDDYFKVKYIDGGGYVVYLNDKYVIELREDLSKVIGYGIETSYKIGDIESRFMGEYVDSLVCVSNSSGYLLGYTLLKDLETKELKVLEFSAINCCKVLDLGDISYFHGSLGVDGDKVQSIYFNVKDLVCPAKSHMLWYRGKMYVLLGCIEYSVEDLVKDRDKFISWYNSNIDKGWDFNLINSLINYMGYSLDVVTDIVSRGISLKMVKLGFNNMRAVEYFSVGVSSDRKLCIV